jgi:hypothetical protein
MKNAMSVILANNFVNLGLSVNIITVDVKETGNETMDCADVSQVTDSWQAHVNTDKLSVSIKLGECLD